MSDNSQLTQAKFLLLQAPMMQTPNAQPMWGGQWKTWIVKQTVRYAYINPKTWATISGFRDGKIVTLRNAEAGKITSWIPTDLMPENCVIFTPNLMPGIEIPEEKK